MGYGYYLEQRYIHSTAMVLARLLTPEEAAALHYEDGFRGVGEDRYTTYVDGFESEEAARAYMRTLRNGLLMEGDALKDWDAIPTERGVLTLTLTERDRSLILTALEHLPETALGSDAARQCGILMARLRSTPMPESDNTDGQVCG